ncbi:hypothetical protein [uncultured Enterococcus sp.]|uniref:hypothetical protein n=1 Tax=uncultured Enterococcus sp. TaxID=167972 RepID=UPI0025972DE3|nr:hypothetical protein [uncultured Enterococcus sp.]
MDLNYLEIDRMKARILGKLNQAFSASYEDGSEAFVEAMEELEQLKPYYQQTAEEELAEG